MGFIVNEELLLFATEAEIYSCMPGIYIFKKIKLIVVKK